MGRPLKLESFDVALAGGPVSPTISELALEEERLKAFDKGYRAGWDDASAAHEEDQRRISVELAANLQELSFTYHEARSSILKEFDGLLRGMTSKVFPESLGATLGEMIVQQLDEAANALADVPVEVVVAPENVVRIEQITSGMVAPPLKVIEEDSLGAGQAFLRMGRSETRIDLDALLGEIASAVSDFFDQMQPQEMAHA